MIWQLLLITGLILMLFPRLRRRLGPYGWIAFGVFVVFLVVVTAATQRD